MEQRVSFITLAVADLDRTRAFYVDGLGWTPELFVPGEVLMIRVGDKVDPLALVGAGLRGRGRADPAR